MTDYSRMKVVELKAELKRLGLPQNGLKAELVARLEEAAASEESPAETPAETEQSPAEATTATEPNEAQPSEVAKPASNSPEPSGTDSAHEPQATSITDIDMAQDSSRNDPQAQVITPHAIASETPSLPTTDVVQDVQKRKRRSTTPTPSDEVARKRLRQDDVDESRDATSDAASNKRETPKPDNEDTDQVPMMDVDTSATHDEGRTDEVPEPDGEEDLSSGEPINGAREEGNTRSAITEVNDGGAGDVEDIGMPDAGATSLQRGTYSAIDDVGQETRDPEHSPSPEQDIEPSIHPATRALYIKNFMRPLRPQTVRDHLLELATPANAPLDSSTIANFYLDNIRTHAFAVFTSVSAASRVRTALHKRIWPDETNRKALWIDFIPPECIEDWIAIEQQARNTGNMPRYEVVYDHDNDGNVLAKLEETDANQATRRGPASPIIHADRRTSIPTGPSRPSGIENAPTGPRNPYSHNGPTSMYPGRQERLDSGFIKTKSGPPVLYRPVAPELIQRRLDILAQAKDPQYSYDESGRDYHRYYFERDDVLVNRGPEIFLGIRPPHREKERRELARTGGGDPRDRNFRDRRGPLGPPGAGGGGGRRRRRATRPHGVPRGGDRFRPAPFYDDRSAFDDRHPSRRDDYGGGSSRRKDSHRY
ncbi:hypothetical protein F4859DRAFT_462662 [Xylaria cf. heliscus]|nr:hypothetical protein F4859DRAFT_462662 [Xylaria cf. heliscus]